MTIELAVVQDADRLDAMGAIGVARSFAYGGFKKRAMYDPAQEPSKDLSQEAYKSNSSPTINHFYEKLFRLKDLMKTKAGKGLAQERFIFLSSFSTAEFMILMQLYLLVSEAQILSCAYIFRHIYMQDFVARFFLEWNAEA